MWLNDFITFLKKRTKQDGMWTNRYIRLLSALDENNYFDRSTIPEPHVFHEKLSLDELAGRTFQLLAEVDFLPEGKPVASLNRYLTALPGFAWSDRYSPAGFNEVARDQHARIAFFVSRLLAEFSDDKDRN